VPGDIEEGLRRHFARLYAKIRWRGLAALGRNPSCTGFKPMNSATSGRILNVEDRTLETQ